MTKEIKGLLIYVQFLYGRYFIGKYFLINYVLHLQSLHLPGQSHIKKYSKVCNMLKVNNKKTRTC